MNPEINPNNNDLKLSVLIKIVPIFTIVLFLLSDLPRLILVMGGAISLKYMSFLYSLWNVGIFFSFVSTLAIFYFSHKNGPTKEGFRLIKISFLLVVIFLITAILSALINAKII